jgi:hypothetical protein
VSPGSIREETGALKMQVAMQERLIEAECKYGLAQRYQIEAQRNQLENQLLRERDHSASLGVVHERSIDSLNQHAIRQDAKAAFVCFQQPTDIQGRMYSEYLAIGLSQPQKSSFERGSIPEQRIPVQLTAAPVPLVIDNGPSTTPVMPISNGTATVCIHLIMSIACRLTFLNRYNGDDGCGKDRCPPCQP